ncbi:hypothetical protein [uncultured Methylobacterium sp.]|uniref:hypothetical protein n=1 Tax=uncultured Methylobacterium sp. TaxID=157278 RepID=UPI0025956FE2|nr:hypothetical protein [uncultured Methylobacterium sp.]
MSDPDQSVPAPTPPDRPRRIVLRARWVARASALIGVAASLTVLAGWWFDVPALRRIVPG